MKKIKVFLFVLAATSFAACGGSDDNNGTPERRPSKIEKSDGKEKETFKYDGDGRITEFVQTDNTEADTYGIVYRDGKVFQIQLSQHENGNFIGGTTISVNYVSDTKINLNSNNGNATLTLDANGNITSMTSETGTSSYTYDNKGNLTKIIEDGLEDIYAYSSYKGVLSGVKSPKWLLTIIGSQFATQAVNAPSNNNYDGTSTSFFYDESSFVDGYPSKIQYNSNSTESGTTSGTYNVSY